MGSGQEPAFHERARSGPLREYVAALRETWAPAKRCGATQVQLARSGNFAEATVSKYFSGERIATAEFVDALVVFVTTATDGEVIATWEWTERLHTLRRQAEGVGSAKTQLNAAKEKIRRLEEQLEAFEAAHRTGADLRVKELEEQLDRSAKEINRLSQQLKKVQKDLRAERDRNRRAALESSMIITSLAVRGLDGVIRLGRPQDEIIDEQKMASDLLITVGHLQQRIVQLQGGPTGSMAATSQEKGLPRLREREGVLFRHAWPVRIYTTSATLSASALLLINITSFVATWRDDAGLTIAQLIAYVILVFPVTLFLWGLLTASALFVAYGHNDDFGAIASVFTVLIVAVALLLGIGGPFFLPPLTWLGHAWAVYIGTL